MLQLFRRHLILTVCTVVAIVLVFIGWWVRPDVAPSPGLTAPPPENVEEPGPAPVSAMPAEAEPVVAMESTEACEIPPDWLQVEGRWDREISEERIDRILEYAEAAFIESKNIDELVFATTLNDQSGLGIERFVEEISSGARSPYLLFKAVDRCYAKNGSAAYCPREQWLELLTQLDSENSEVWIRVAGLRFVQGDDEAGMAALQRAATASGSDDYYARDLQNFVNGFSASGDVTRYEAVRLAQGLAASDLPAIEYHFYACTSPDISDARRLALCEQYVSNVQSRGTTEILRNVTERIDLFNLEARGSVEAAEQLQQQRDERTVEAMANILTEQASELLERLNPDLLYEYVNDVALYGELEAIERRKRRLEEAGLADFMQRCGTELEAYEAVVEAG